MTGAEVIAFLRMVATGIGVVVEIKELAQRLLDSNEKISIQEIEEVQAALNDKVEKFLESPAEEYEDTEDA